jgi:hypothetical protein
MEEKEREIIIKEKEKEKVELRETKSKKLYSSPSQPNNLLQSKTKLSSSLLNSSNVSNNSNVNLKLNLMKSFTPDKPKIKLRQSGTTQQLGMIFKVNQYSQYQSMIPSNTPYKFTNAKLTDRNGDKSERLPYIKESASTKRVSISISKPKLSGSISDIKVKKLVNSSSISSLAVKNYPKFSTITSNSTGISTNSMHRRSGSTISSNNNKFK